MTVGHEPREQRGDAAVANVTHRQDNHATVHNVLQENI
jgi:hypothetical protein